LKRYGEGVVHHLGMEVEDYDKALIFFKSKGIEAIQSGNYLNKLRYSYLSTSSDLSYVVELAETNRSTDFFP
ncbi:MAG: VOC family protein, partial [Candidatus Humimicrobiaceae bacterium]